jgi:hypothetical protein
VKFEVPLILCDFSFSLAPLREPSCRDQVHAKAQRKAKDAKESGTSNFTITEGKN